MKHRVLLSALLLGVAALPVPAELAAAPPERRVPVVVELFTSEGCSSCPAADAVLRELAVTQPLAGVEIIALGQHVDYWNRLGWPDPFSAAQFTDRQRAYAARLKSTVYTPQAVVQGQTELVGSQRAKLVAAIGQAAHAAQATVQLAATASSLTVKVAEMPAGAVAQVLLAFTEANLTTPVKRGENAGRVLRHAPVVRALRPLGKVGAAGTFAATVPLHIAADWHRAQLRAVVVVQEASSGRVLGAASLPLAGE